MYPRSDEAQRLDSIKRRIADLGGNTSEADHKDNSSIRNAPSSYPFQMQSTDISSGEYEIDPPTSCDPGTVLRHPNHFSTSSSSVMRRILIGDHHETIGAASGQWHRYANRFPLYRRPRHITVERPDKDAVHPRQRDRLRRKRYSIPIPSQDVAQFRQLFINDFHNVHVQLLLTLPSSGFDTTVTRPQQKILFSLLSIWSLSLVKFPEYGADGWPVAGGKAADLGISSRATASGGRTHIMQKTSYSQMWRGRERKSMGSSDYGNLEANQCAR
ncbi:hypothetical protein B0H11DRAFT_1918594 [Mycena galericulata]|nr:hypothetical protein B0H11DRAFT_1918594 [Mycena galericulata]